MYIVGKISEQIAQEAGIPAGTIVINDKQLKHIENDHKSQFEHLGIDAWSYVNMICANFDTIIKNKDNSYMLVKTNKLRSSATLCMVEMILNTHGKWLVTTAQPRDKPLRTGKIIIWQKKKK